MKRKLDDTLPPAKKRKLDNAAIQQIELHDPTVIIPKLEVFSVSNGIVQIGLLNINSFIDQELTNHALYQIELMYKCHDNEWQSICDHSAISTRYEHFYLKVLVDIQDYTLTLKARAMLNKTEDGAHNKWSAFCDSKSIVINSSLIAHRFQVGDYVEFRDKNEYYSREGRVIKLLPDQHLRIRPFPQYVPPRNNESNHNNVNNAAFDFFAEIHNLFSEQLSDDDDHKEEAINMDTIDALMDDSEDDDEDDDGYQEIQRYLQQIGKDKLHSRDVDVHYSRIYEDGIRLYSVVDISHNQQNVDKMILLRTNDDNMMDVYSTLLELFCSHAKKYVDDDTMDYDEDYELQYMGRFVGKQVCDFLLPNDRTQNGERFKWKITCLRNANDGVMHLNPVRRDVIDARIDGLRGNIHGMNMFDIDCVVGFCDLCRLEISDYDWRYNCDQHITDKHDICMTCIYNVIHQYLQFNALLQPILTHDLNDDCIQEITNFVVGPVVKL